MTARGETGCNTVEILRKIMQHNFCESHTHTHSISTAETTTGTGKLIKQFTIKNCIFDFRHECGTIVYPSFFRLLYLKKMDICIDHKTTK